MNNLAHNDMEQPRFEIIGGKVVNMSPGTANHSLVKGGIYAAFHTYISGKRKTGSRCVVFPDGVDVWLGKDKYIPDMCVVCDPEKIKLDGVHGAPDLVVEALSPTTAKYDRGAKKDVYERYGVKEYWLVNPDQESIEVYLLQDGKFALDEVYSIYPEYLIAQLQAGGRPVDEKTIIKPSIFDDLEIDLHDVFYNILR